MELQWDETKARSNETKHGVTFEEGASVLADFRTIVFESPHPSEQRFIAIGYSATGRVLLVVFCKRDENIIRIISARRASKKERQQYEEGI